MANIAKANILVNSSKGEWVLTGAQLQSEDYASNMEEIQSLGEGKGVPFSPRVGEKITFPKFDDAEIVLRVTTIGGKEYKILSLMGKSDQRGDVEVPMALFRRLPALDADRIKLFEGHPLVEELLSAQLSDLGRILRICGHTLCFQQEHTMLRQTFTPQAGGKFSRDDEETVRKKADYIHPWWFAE